MTQPLLSAETFENIYVFMPEIGLSLIGFFLLLYGVLRTKQETDIIASSRMYGGAMVVSLFLITVVLLEGGVSTSFAHGLVKKDFLTLFMTALLIGSFVPFIASTPKILAISNIKKAAYYPLNIFALLGMVITVSANNCLTLFVGLELTALSFYALLGIRRNMVIALEGALKYYTLGAIAAGFLLLGCAFYYGATGELTFHVPASSNPDNPFTILFLVGMFFMLMGLLFKLSAAPFHFWSPDVYEGSSNVQLVFLAVGGKIAAAIALLRLLTGPFAFLSRMWEPLLLGAAILSLLIGAFGALLQTKIRRFVAYSSIGHVGFILMALLPGSVDMTPLLVYLITYMLSVSGLMLTISGLHKEDFEILNLEDLKGLYKHHSRSAFFLAVFLFSLAGIPPLGLFWGKFYVLVSIIEQEMYWLAIFALLASVVSAFYYLRVIKYMYFDKSDVAPKVYGHEVISLVFAVAVILFPILQTVLTPYFIEIAKQIPLG